MIYSNTQTINGLVNNIFKELQSDIFKNCELFLRVINKKYVLSAETKKYYCEIGIYIDNPLYIKIQNIVDYISTYYVIYEYSSIHGEIRLSYKM